MKRALTLLAVLVLLLLAGCASLDHAGSTTYIVRSFTGPMGMVACCELEVKDGKEYEGRTVQFQTTGSAAVLAIQEGTSKAFKGQGIAGKAATVLPVNLGDVLK